jgi:hypothetical protein
MRAMILSAPPTVFGDLVEIAAKHFHRLVDLGTLLIIQCSHHRTGGFFQFVEHFDRQPGKVVDEVERVLDFVIKPAVS